MQFFPPSLLQSAACVSPLGCLLGHPGLVPLRKEGLYVQRMALLHTFSQVILVSIILFHCPHEQLNVPEMPTSWQPNYIS